MLVLDFGSEFLCFSLLSVDSPISPVKLNSHHCTQNVPINSELYFVYWFHSVRWFRLRNSSSNYIPRSFNLVFIFKSHFLLKSRCEPHIASSQLLQCCIVFSFPASSDVQDANSSSTAPSIPLWPQVFVSVGHLRTSTAIFNLCVLIISASIRIPVTDSGFSLNFNSEVRKVQDEYVMYQLEVFDQQQFLRTAHKFHFALIHFRWSIFLFLLFDVHRASHWTRARPSTGTLCASAFYP